MGRAFWSDPDREQDTWGKRHRGWPTCPVDGAARTVLMGIRLGLGRVVCPTCHRLVRYRLRPETDTIDVEPHSLDPHQWDGRERWLPIDATWRAHRAKSAAHRLRSLTIRRAS